MIDNFSKNLKFDENGLITVIVQDYRSSDVLMVAYMNKEAIDITLKTKKATFWSRSRKSLWVKGEISGNTQEVIEFYYDCDGDSILLKVNQIGIASCHTGRKTCFFTKVLFDGSIKIISEQLFDPDEIYKK
jgi:phosphoribosyl-AMP cyclohydrolase